MAARRFLSWFVFGCLLFASAGASAQVKQGSVRVWLDTSLVGYTKLETEDSAQKEVQSSFTIGPDGPAYALLPGYVGLGLGYVAHAHVIPSLHLSFNHMALKDKVTGKQFSGDSSNDSLGANTLLFQPQLELPFNPDSSVVLSGIVGIDLRHTKVSQGDQWEKTTGYGPAFGAVAHFFVVPKASLDLTALAAVDFWSSKAGGGGSSEDHDHYDTYRSFTFGLLAGLSLWP